MQNIGCYEAKTRLPALLKRVSAGERITITKHGHPIAVLSPPDAAPRRSFEDLLASIRRNRKGTKLRGASLKKLIAEAKR